MYDIHLEPLVLPHMLRSPFEQMVPSPFIEINGFLNPCNQFDYIDGVGAPSLQFTD